MNFFLKITIILLISLNINAKETQYEFNSRFGFLEGGTILSSFQDARIALKVWLEDLSLKYGGRMEATFYSSETDLYNDFKKNKLDMIILSPPYFFEHKKQIDKISSNYWSLSISDSKYLTYYLVTNIKNKVNSFEKINGGSLVVRDIEVMSKIWLEKNILKTKKIPLDKVVDETVYVKKDATALLNVFFNKKDYALVNKNTWDTMVELNPSIKKRVKIIKTSKSIHYPLIGIFSKQADEKAVKAFFKLSANLKTIEGSEQIFDLLKFNGIFKIDDNSMNELEKYYDEYFKLKKSYR